MSHSLFVCTHLNGFKYCYLTLIIQFDINHLYTNIKWLQIYIRPIDGTTSLGQNEDRSNDNEEVLHIPLMNVRSKTLASPSDSG